MFAISSNFIWRLEGKLTLQRRPLFEYMNVCMQFMHSRYTSTYIRLRVGMLIAKIFIYSYLCTSHKTIPIWTEFRVWACKMRYDLGCIGFVSLLMAILRAVINDYNRLFWCQTVPVNSDSDSCLCHWTTNVVGPFKDVASGMPDMLEIAECLLPGLRHGRKPDNLTSLVWWWNFWLLC